jgi:hypothetical protein
VATVSSSLYLTFENISAFFKDNYTVSVLGVRDSKLVEIWIMSNIHKVPKRQ